jgi:hypothetical protein
MSLPLCVGLILAFYLSLSPFQKNKTAVLKDTTKNASAPHSIYTYIIQAFIPALKNLK